MSDAWELLIREGREIAQSERLAKWRLADLLCAAREARGLVQFLEQTGLEINLQTAIKLERTAQAWPPERRVDGCAFHAHTMLNYKPNRFKELKPGMSCAQVQLMLKHKVSTATYSVTDYLRASLRFLRLGRGQLPRDLSVSELTAIGDVMDDLVAEVQEALVELEMDDPALPLAAAA